MRYFFLFLFSFPLFAYDYITNDHTCPNGPAVLTSSASVPSIYVKTDAQYAYMIVPHYACTSSAYTVYTTTGISSDAYYYYGTSVTKTYTYVTTCPTGQILNAEGVCKAPECPTDTILDTSGKYCVPQICPIGSTRDPITLHCLPIKCPTGQTLISDGTCQTTCPPNSSRVGKICLYDCGHWSKDQCGKYTDSKGNTCKWSYGDLWTHTISNNSVGSCVTETQANKDIENLIPFIGPSSIAPFRSGVPKLPDYEPQPLPKRTPDNNPDYAPPLKPANDPDYVPSVTPKPVEPIPVKPVEPNPYLVPMIPIPNDPDYIPTVPDPTPLSPDIAPYVAPAPEPAPAPLPLPAPEVLPAPAPSPAPLPAPAPSPIAVPLPAPLPSPVPLPMPKPDYAFDPVPEPAPVPDPVYDPITGELIPAPAPVPSPYPVAEPLPNVAMPGIPDVLDFSIDDMDRFRYQAELMSDNILDQVDNVQNTFTNTMNILNQGFPPVSLPDGTCGSSMAFNFYGRHIDLCPPLAESSAQFAPLFQLLIFLVGLIASIKIFISGLRD